MSSKPWLSVIEAAKELGVSENTIRRGIANGTIPSIRPAGPRGTIRIPRGALREWLANTGVRG